MRTLHFRTSTLRTELQSLKGRDGQPPTRRRGAIHAKRKGRCLEQRPYPYAKNRRPTEEWGRESEAPWTYTISPYREVRLPEEPLASPHAWKTSAWNAQAKRITARPPKQTNPQGRARGNRARRRRAKTHSFVGERDTHRVLARSEDNRMWNSPCFRADRPTKGWHKDTPRTSRKKRSQQPNRSNSFIRDQIVRSRPDRGDPILKEYRPDIQSRLRYDRAGENTLDPQGDPIAKQRRIDERKQPSFRSSVQKSATRPDTGDPITKARHQPLEKERE